jgi:hypothetical protein
MHPYNCIRVVLLVSRLTLVVLSPKLSCGIDKVLVCLCPCESCYNWHLYALAGYYVRLKDHQQAFWHRCQGQLCQICIFILIIFYT